MIFSPKCTALPVPFLYYEKKKSQNFFILIF